MFNSGIDRQAKPSNDSWLVESALHPSPFHLPQGNSGPMWLIIWPSWLINLPSIQKACSPFFLSGGSLSFIIISTQIHFSLRDPRAGSILNKWRSPKCSIPMPSHAVSVRLEISAPSRMGAEVVYGPAIGIDAYIPACKNLLKPWGESPVKETACCSSTFVSD